MNTTRKITYKYSKVNILPIINYALEVYGNETYTAQIDKYIKKFINIITFKKYTNTRVYCPGSFFQVPGPQSRRCLDPGIILYDLLRAVLH